MTTGVQSQFGVIVVSPFFSYCPREEGSNPYRIHMVGAHAIGEKMHDDLVRADL